MLHLCFTQHVIYVTEPIDDCHKLAIQSNVKELDLFVTLIYLDGDLVLYCIPKLVLNSTLLTVLKLKDIWLMLTFPTIPPSLENLSLIDVLFTLEDEQKEYENLFSKSPIIKNLHFQ